MPTDEKPLSQIVQNPPPEGFDACCPAPVDCTKECKKIFETESITEITKRPGCKCTELETTITTNLEACILDTEWLGCEVIGELGQQYTTIIEQTLKFCQEEYGDGCDGGCPMECELKGPHVEYHKDLTAEPPLCWCECETPYFGPRCLREGYPYCDGIDHIDRKDYPEADILHIRGQYFYSDDVLVCNYAAVSSDGSELGSYRTNAAVHPQTMVCDGVPQPTVGEPLCRYTMVTCEAPPPTWLSYYYGEDWYSAITVSVISDIYNTDTNPDTQGPCGYPVEWTCRDVLSNLGYPELNPCEKNNNYVIDTLYLDEIVPSNTGAYDFCCSNTPAPTPEPTPAPTNSPTWPAHVFVPVLDRHAPWYVDFTPPPTAITVDYVTPTIVTPYVYVPANNGAMTLPYCLGFGDQCEPVYGEY